MESPKERKARIEREAKEQKAFNNKMTVLRRKIKSDIIKSGVLSVTYKLELIKNNPALIGDFDLPVGAVYQAYEEVIEKYKNRKQ